MNVYSVYMVSMTTHTNPEPTEYLSCADTAKLLRESLKATFPKVKFSVRSHTYSGGASIDVGWVDGPTEDQVRQVTYLYSGATFDGMIDLKSYHDSIIAGPDGQPMVVSFGADFIFANRKVSDELLDYLAEHAAQNHQHNGRTRGGEQCAACGNWMPEGDCWTAGAESHLRFVCSDRCAARYDARIYDASPGCSGFTA